MMMLKSPPLSLELNHSNVLEYKWKVLALIFEPEEVAKISSSSISSTNDKHWNKPLEMKVDQKEQ
jgi:hypothetical protein